MSAKNKFIPWILKKEWYQANITLERLIQDYKMQLYQVVLIAKKIENQLNTIFPILDQLCYCTCPVCPDPCCLRATIWIDFQDLLFLHLTGQAIPCKQLLSAESKNCIYATKQGCLLPRISRPWICTWYICPEQKNILRQHPLPDQTRLLDLLESIKSLRKDMEDEFLKQIVG